MNSNSSYSPETPNSAKNQQFFVPCDLEIQRMTLKNNRAPLLYYFKFCESFRGHEWIQTGVTVLKSSIRLKIADVLSHVTLKNNRAPLLCYFKLCASFRSHQRIQTVVTVRKCLIQVTIADFLSQLTLKFDRWPWKTIGHLSYGTLSFVHHFIAICEFKLELRSGNGKIGFWPTAVTLTIYSWPLPFAWRSLLSMLIIHENFMMIRWSMETHWKRCDEQTDIEPDRWTEP